MAKENNRAGVSAALSADADIGKPQPGKMAGENLDKVRDILFGSQARDYEKRFARLEERLVREASDLREDLKKRFDTIETYIKKEIESLSDKLKTEHDERAAAAKEIASELKDAARAFEKKTGQLDEYLAKAQRELRQQILEQSKSLSDDIRQKHDAITAALERETSELRGDKTDRVALASLFMEIAMRLNNDFKIPEPEDLD